MQVYLMMQHAQANYNMKFFMKSDDDTYVNIPVMLHALRESVKDRFVYIGYRVRKTSRYASLSANKIQLSGLDNPSFSSPQARRIW